jgi:Rad3-related DNA helicase
VVVGDYNHYFDASALLHGLAQPEGWRVGVLVDEAHNLLDRARGMYSASLSSVQLRSLRKSAPADVKVPLDRLQRAWTRLVKDEVADAAVAGPYRVLDAPPAALVAALERAPAAIGVHLADSPAGVGSELLAFYFDALQFTRLLETFGSHSLCDLTIDAVAGSGGAARAPASTLCLRNVVPAAFLRPRLAAARAAVLFSATLAPHAFYFDTLGLPGDAAWLDVEAPFKAEQLAVRIVREVSTRYADRHGSLAPIARLIGTQYAAAPGNYLAFFSSHDYLRQAAEAFARLCPHIPMWQQAARMDEAERAAFLARFAPDGRGVGFAVLGGSFAEGIDLAGSRLIGAFIATLGLPQFNPVNEQLRRRLEADFGAGYDYTYLYPGIRKVVQAAGRVIRTLSDRGSVHLIDDRFARPQVRRLLPRWWAVQTGAGSAALAVTGAEPVLLPEAAAARPPERLATST